MNSSNNETRQEGYGNMHGNSVIQAYGNHFFSAFDISLDQIVEHVPTEILTLRKEKVMIEDLLRLVDDTLLHIVFQASANPDDLDRLLDRLMEYDLKIYEKHERLISTIVVFGPEINNAELSRDLGAIKYKITEAVWLSRWNGDQIIEGINGDSELKDEELSMLVMLPFMNTKVSRFQRAMESVQIAKQLFDEEKREKVIKIMVAMAGKLLSDAEHDQFVQALRKQDYP
ncbi:hypothetical protein [Brevibacillus choshinensis]|uniref:Uncharacterized protein n=1 Tax=Brevibacillus choshinensis TaxID=54911 RepID=A0ABX7FIE4_BRECH|nr:hypothetical protein [Brevibacillus choshinensis]QRG65989.1 hypothetical protein JNE38_20745 [Brevibacillus choshinensis]